MAHIAKYQAAALGGMLAHYARTPELERGYRRDNIDPARTRLNYNLAPAHPSGQVDFIDGRIASLGLKRKVRKDAVRMCDCVLTMPKSLDPSRSREFFEDAYAFLANRYGAENVVSAYVHMDESMPHMHFAWVPVTEDGRLSAKDVVTRASLRTLHADLQKSLEKAMGCQVDVLIPEDRRQEQAAKYVGLAEFKAATAGARKAAEQLSEAQKAAETAESRKRDSEAAAEASVKARKQATADAEAAKKDLETQRRRAKQLGPEGKGIDWHYTDGHVEHESSVGEVRAERDAAKAEAAAALKKRDGLLAFADEIRGERYEIDGRTYKGISAMADELKGLRADCAAAKNELAAAQDKAAAAEADLKELEAAKAQAEASLSKIQDDERKARVHAHEWHERAIAHYHEMHLTPDDLLDALLIMARRVADVVCQLWVRARDIAVQEWNVWQTQDLPRAAGDMGIYLGDAYEISDRAMRETADAYRHPEIADDLLDMPGQSQERGYDDWER